MWKRLIKTKQLISWGALVALLLTAGILSRCESRSEKILPLTNSWDTPIPHQEIPEGLSSLSAEQCGACHKEHYDEWKMSTHAHAWTDLQFQAELKKESSPFMCINCHAPLQNQQEHIIEGLINGDVYNPKRRENPHFDAQLRQEGINCAACHVRDNTVIGPTGSSKAPHKTKKDPAFLSEQLCFNCHNASAVVTPELACTFETGDEWKAGPYFGKKNCISCHMETKNREIVPGYGVRKSTSHFFPGSGIPKHDTLKVRMLSGLSFYPSIQKETFKVQEPLRFDLKIVNEHAGHNVPTGDPERFVEVVFELRNNNGKLLATQRDTIGEKWEWYPKAKKISDNNLKPNEARNFPFTYQPKDKGDLRLVVIVKKHRLNEESAAYNGLGKEYPLSITIFEKEYEVKID